MMIVAISTTMMLTKSLAGDLGDPIPF